MNKPHKWAKEIAHYISGGEVEYKCKDPRSIDNWDAVPSLEAFDQTWFIFRTKKEKKTMKVAVFKGKDGMVTPLHESELKNARIQYWTKISDWVEIQYEDDQS